MSRLLEIATYSGGIMELEEIIKDSFLVEKLIIQLMFKDTKFRDTVLPYIKPDMIQYPHPNSIITNIHSFIGEYGEFPKAKTFAMSIKDVELARFFADCFSINTNDFNYDHLLMSIETYIRRSLLLNHAAEITSVIHDSSGELESLQNMPDSVRDALTFSFETNIGVDLCSDDGIDSFFNFLTDTKSKVEIVSLPTINKMIGGGALSKSLNLLVGGTNAGKSASMCSMAADNIVNDKKVLYITLEMSEFKIGERILANVSDTNIDDIPFLGKDKLKDKIFNIKNIMNSIIIKEYPPSTINANMIRKLLKDLKEKKGFVPDIVYIDYIGLMKPNISRKSGSKYEDLKTISEEVRAIAVEENFPIWSVAQTNRGGMNSGLISLTDIAESFGIAMTADLVISLNQPDELKSMGRFIWVIIKHRIGVNMQSTQVAMNFKKMKLSETNEPIKIVDSVGETIDFNGGDSDSDANDNMTANSIINNRLHQNNVDNIKKITGFVFT